MITREDAEKIREELTQLLAEDAHNTQALLERLNTLTQESGIGAHAALLLILTHLAFEEREARSHWGEILSRRDELKEKLGRDPGIRMAVLDYFMNVNRQLVQPTLIELSMLESTARDAAQDKLTGLATDATFRAALWRELRRARRYDQHLSVILFDLDDFAAANAQFGDLVGDRLLRESAILLSNKIRDIDIAARLGEDELALLLPETDRSGALLVAERFRAELERYFARRESGGRPVKLTASGGAACFPEDARTPDTLLQCAAQALYQAKAAGKNDVQVYHPERRRYLRFELAPGRFEVEVLEPADPGPFRLRNLSRNGILFASPEALEVGEEIEIRLAGGAGSNAPSGLRIRGRVVRLEELPPPLPAEAETAVADDRFEIGVAFDLDWTDGTDDLLSFLERSQGSRLGASQ